MKTKNTLMTAATIFAAVGLQAAYLTAPIKIDTRFVGDAGNAADTGGTVGTGANDISLVTRNDAAWQAGGIAIASLDEWYKVAFYQGNGTYSTYANGTNTAPTADEANYNISGIGTITDVDFGVASHYGTYGQNGNVWEWTDTVTGSATNVYRRGGFFASTVPSLGASNNNGYTAAYEYYDYGFRVSSLEPIPEPSTYAAIFGALALAVAVYRRRK